MNVAIFITCLGDNYFPRSGIAAVKVLRHFGCTVWFPAQQTCCGQPMHNNGFAGEARALAAGLIEAFEGAEYVVTSSGSCAAMVRESYPGLFEPGSAMRARSAALAGKMFEFAEFLVDVLAADIAGSGACWPGRVTWHYPCHLRGIGQTDQAVRLLRQVKGLEFVPLRDATECCGFGGTFATKYHEISGAMVHDKVRAIVQTGAPVVVSSEPGCTMNIAGACRREGCGVSFKSLAEILAESLGLMEREKS